MNVLSYKTRPKAKDFIQVEILVERNSQKIIVIGRVCHLYQNSIDHLWTYVIDCRVAEKLPRYYYDSVFVALILSLSLISFSSNLHVCYAQLLQEGKALKLLATASRLDVEDFLQKKVFLEVHIYVVFILYLCYIKTWSSIFFRFIYYSVSIQYMFRFEKYLLNTSVWTLNRFK